MVKILSLHNESTHNTRPRLYLCIYFPEWSIDVTQRKLAALAADKSSSSQASSESKTILLTTTAMNQRIIARACRLSRSLGVRQKMSLALAQALVPSDTYHEEFDPLRDAYALRALAAWCLRFSPIVGLDFELSQRLLSPSRHHELASLARQHYGITIDITGTTHINGEPEQFCHKLQALLCGTTRIALAPSLGGAWALSRYSSKTPSIALSFESLATLSAPLPVRALRIDAAMCRALSDIGVYTIGDLNQLQRQSLGQRFGKTLVYRLAQVSGSVSEHVSVVTQAPAYREHAIFEVPLTNRHAITTALKHLFNKLMAKLSLAHLATSLFKISITDTEGVTIYKALPLASATSNQAHLESIIHPIIESMRFCGEICSLTLEALEVTRTSQSQRSLHGDETKDPTALNCAFNELLNSFSVRLGKDRIRKAALTPSHTPERSFKHPPLIAAQPLIKSSPATSAASSNHETSLPLNLHSIYSSPFDRPPLIVSPPEQIISIAMLPDKPPSWIRWRGAKLSIITGLGPERLSLEWWRGDLLQGAGNERDYFTIQDELGRWLWVFRCRKSLSWFVHGIWR
jgi:protein ImuB